jgi:hypothetical protein
MDVDLEDSQIPDVALTTPIRVSSELHRDGYETGGSVADRTDSVYFQDPEF